MPELRPRPLMRLELDLAPSTDAGPSPLGNRRIFPVRGGRFEGDRIEQTENARHNFRLLPEQTQGVQQGTAENYAKNLEAVIRLERMDLSELQGLPLPKQCQGCKDCSQKCRGQKASRCQQPKEPKDARGAGVGKRPEGSGS